MAVPGEGPVGAVAMIVGEGPGREEDRTGRPFVGRAGRLLEALLAHAGLRREDVYITNIIKSRAVTRTAPQRDRSPAPPEIEACAAWLRQQMALIRPRIVVTLGRHAMEWFLPGARIGDVHGRPQRPLAGTPMRAQAGREALVILPLYHPSYALHNPGARPVLFRDIEPLHTLLRTTAGGRARQGRTPEGAE